MFFVPLFPHLLDYTEMYLNKSQRFIIIEWKFIPLIITHQRIVCESAHIELFGRKIQLKPKHFICVHKEIIMRKPLRPDIKLEWCSLFREYINMRSELTRPIPGVTHIGIAHIILAVPYQFSHADSPNSNLNDTAEISVSMNELVRELKDFGRSKLTLRCVLRA